jgi:hypothetical protein
MTIFDEGRGKCAMEIFYDIADGQGWSEESQVSVLSEYVENQQSAEAFRDLLAEKWALEADAGSKAPDDWTLESVSGALGWTPATQVEVLLEYIDNQGDLACFKDFLMEQADQERSLGGEI